MQQDPAAPAQGAGITVRVRLFATYRETADAPELDLQLSAAARVREAAAALMERWPALRLDHGLTAVNREYVGPDFRLREGDEIAFIPPVSGGACSGS